MEFGLSLAVSMILLSDLVRPPVAGKPAPGFRLPATDGRTYASSDFRGRQPVVLVWYPALPT